MSQNFRKFGSGDFELLPFFSSNEPTDKTAFGQFGWFSQYWVIYLHCIEIEKVLVFCPYFSIYFSSVC